MTDLRYWMTLFEAASDDQIEEAAWWLSRWISGSMTDPDWDDSWTTMNLTQAFEILHQVVGNRHTANKMLWRSIVLSTKDARNVLKSKILSPHKAAFQSFSTSKQVAVEFEAYQAPGQVNVLVSVRPPIALVMFGMADLKRSRNAAVGMVLQQLDLWHHQDEVIVKVVSALPLVSAEIIDGT